MERQKINLNQAREILAKQGYVVELTYDEVLEERYNVCEDAKTLIEQRFSEGFYSTNGYAFVELDDILVDAAYNFCELRKEKIKSRFNKLFDDNDLVADIFWDCIGIGIDEAFTQEFVDFKYNPLSETISYVNDIVRKRKDDYDFYVLHYDISTGKYLNEIITMNLHAAIAIYQGSKMLNENDRIELIFSPKDNDEEFSVNVVIAWKGANKNE